MPATAPWRFMRLEKMPSMRTGKMDEAARPGNGHVPAANPAGSGQNSRPGDGADHGHATGVEFVLFGNLRLQTLE